MRCSMVSALADKAMEANAKARIVLRIEEYSAIDLVMPGLVPGIHVLIASQHCKTGWHGRGQARP